jgi:hypothetical protein
MPLLAAPIQDLRGCFLDHVDGEKSLYFALAIDPINEVRFNGRPDAALAFSLVTGPNADVRFQGRADTTLASPLVTGPKVEGFIEDLPDATLDWLQRNYEVDLSKEINFDDVFM